MSTVQQFREPRSTDELHSFLGLVTYVGKFIPRLADLTDPLRELIRKDTKFYWKQSQKEAFLEIKKAMSDIKSLGYYDPEHKTEVIADANPIALGAVLVQLDGKNQPRIIYYASRSLSKTEQRYCQTEKEALALVWAVEKFQIYLYGKEFDLVTDHKPLEAIFKPTSRPCAIVERWVLRLQSYNFKVRYIQGKNNIADPLSRLSIGQPSDIVCEETESYVRSIVTLAKPAALTLEEIGTESLSETEIKAI